jgi:amino acid adenylation domain-containing protein
MLYLLPQAIDRIAERSPDHEAIRFTGRHLSYADLARDSDRLAHVLAGQGVRRGDRVGIYLGKGTRAAVAMYGIMKAGAAYVPLDPGAPVARLALILRDCGIRHLVTDGPRADAARRLMDQEGVSLDCLVGAAPVGGRAERTVAWEVVEAAPAEPPDLRAMEQDLAYVLYTSGSTGVPKGVMHTHRSALSWAEISAHTYGIRPEDRLSNHAPLHFDLSTLDYFAAAVAGATTVVIPEAHTRLPASLATLIQDERLTVLYTVPFALVQLLLRGALEQRDLGALRWVLFGGEPFPTKHLRSLMALLPRARFCNVYGPTEVNGVTHYPVPRLPEGSDEPIPIGRPYGNVELRIVDEADRPVAAGEAGHLLIRSATMMQGYWGRPDLGERAFFRCPAPGHYDQVFHRTGDLVRERPDGNLEFLGRRDRQVKARGHRVELDEVEAVLLSHPAVEAAAVFPVPEPDGGCRLEAAVVPAPGEAPAPAALRSHAAAYLPPYAVPERVAVVAEFPRTSTDKIDRLRLQALATAGGLVPVGGRA